MTGLSICVGGWLVLNAVVFAALMLRRDRPVLREAQPTDSPSVALGCRFQLKSDRALGTRVRSLRRF